LHLEGSAYERGFAHGSLLASELASALSTAKFLAQWDSGEEFDTFAHAGQRLFGPWLENARFAEYRDELQGVADGARSRGVATSLDELVAWNGYMELLGNWWPNRASKDARSLRPFTFLIGPHHCSAFIATGSATATGEIVAAHNTWDCYAGADYFNVLFDLDVPPPGNRILMQGVPGCVSSLTDFWETGAGLVITETTIAGALAWDESKAPEFLRSRYAAEYASSIDDWVERYSSDNNGGYANSWLIGDTKTQEIARYELVLQVPSLERTKDGYYSGFNVASNLKIRTQETESAAAAYSDIRTSGARRVRWEQLFRDWSGRLDAEAARVMIADHYDVYLKAHQPSSRTICGHVELDDGSHSGPYGRGPYYPWGANDGKVTTSELVSEMALWGRWGHACGLPLDAEAFFDSHEQYAWLRGNMKSRPAFPWEQFSVTP
jgi:hypothetical protein